MEPNLKKKIETEIIDCFIFAQKDNFDTLIRINHSEKQKRDYAKKFLMTAFKETRGDYGNPSKKDFEKAITWMIKTAPPASECETSKKHRLKIFDMIKSIEE